VHGADPATAAEAFESCWRLGARRPDAGSWADLVPLLPEALALRVADLRRRAELGGASPADAARLEGAASVAGCAPWPTGSGRRRAGPTARASPGWWPGWPKGAPEAEVSHAAYYGPVRGPEMAQAAARRLARDGACGPGPGSP
jgi:hypothetical protein